MAQRLYRGGNSFGATANLGTNDGNLLAFRTNGTEKMRLTTGGVLEINSTGTPGTVEKIRVNTPTTADNLASSIFSPSATTNKGIVVQGLASQTANLQEWQGSDGTILGKIDSTGNLTIGTNTATGLNQNGAITLQGWYTGGGGAATALTISSGGSNPSVIGSGGGNQLIVGSASGVIFCTTSSCATRFAQLSNAGALTLGTSGTAASGTIRLANAAAISWRNAAGTGDKSIKLSSTNVTDSLDLPGSVVVGGSDATAGRIYYFNGNVSNGRTAASGWDVQIAGVTKLAINSSGQVGISPSSNTFTGGTVELLRVKDPTTVDNLANVIFTASATTSKPLVIQGLASQTANLQEWQSSTGTVLASVSAGGSITGDTIQGVNLVASSSFRTSGTIANSGAIRLANTNNIAWRNAANTGNITAGVNASDILQITSPAADGTTVAQFKNAGVTSCTVQPGGTGFACSSDARLKTNVLTLNNASDIVNKLRGVSFNWLSNPTGQIQSGFIAQELMQVIPGAVSQDSNGFYVANYSAIVPYLVNAFQDSDKRLTALEAKVNDIQLSQGVFSGGIVTGDTVFQAKATFDGLASFKGQTVFAGGATFEGVTNVKGRLQLSNNNTGVATIPNGGNSVHVALPSTFSAAPNINLTPQDFVTGQYRVTHVTTTGFDIETSASQSENITFYWQAF